MKFDIFTEMQKRDLDLHGGFPVLLKEHIEQARMADRCGYDTWWQVEHHATGDFSQSSCPELILEAIALNTERLRIGHSGILAPLKINHWLRSAERAAMLDQISAGRLECGLARSGGKEWVTFQTDNEQTYLDLENFTRFLPRAWTEKSLTFESPNWQCADLEICPKPLQRPHPPLWHTVSSGPSWQRAAELGVGVLCTTLFTPLENLADLVANYKKTAAAPSEAVSTKTNSQCGVFTFTFVGESQKAAIASGAPRSALWYVSSVPKVFNVDREMFFRSVRGQIDPRSRADWTAHQGQEDAGLADENPAVALVKRELAGEVLSNEEIYETIRHMDSVLIGDVETVRRKVGRFRDVGFDRLMCMMQMGEIPKELILGSMQRFASEIMPHYAVASERNHRTAVTV